jgi:PiT family inorganic phosphate transporter
MMLLILLGAGAYVGWNIGANDTANCVGTTVGCGLISYKRAVILVSVFVIIGAMVDGGHVMKTVGRGIINEPLDYLAIFVALVCSGFFVTLATFYRVPTSTSQAIVGGVLGIGLATGAEIQYSKLITIAESWVLCPILVLGLSYGLYSLLTLFIRHLRVGNLLIQNALGWLSIMSSCYLSYAMGANNAGNAVGPIANLGIINPQILLAIGGVSIAIGAITYGRKVADTVGKGITPLDIPGAFIAQVSSGFGMHIFSLMGIPVSTSSAIVGAVVGVGLVKGAKSISKKTIMVILAGWVLTPTLAAVTSFFMYRLLKVVVF